MDNGSRVRHDVTICRRYEWVRDGGTNCYTLAKRSGFAQFIDYSTGMSPSHDREKGALALHTLQSRDTSHILVLARPCVVRGGHARFMDVAWNRFVACWAILEKPSVDLSRYRLIQGHNLKTRSNGYGAPIQWIDYKGMKETKRNSGRVLRKKRGRGGMNSKNPRQD